MVIWMLTPLKFFEPISNTAKLKIRSEPKSEHTRTEWASNLIDLIRAYRKIDINRWLAKLMVNFDCSFENERNEKKNWHVNIYKSNRMILIKNFGVNNCVNCVNKLNINKHTIKKSSPNFCEQHHAHTDTLRT